VDYSQERGLSVDPRARLNLRQGSEKTPKLVGLWEDIGVKDCRKQRERPVGLAKLLTDAEA